MINPNVHGIVRKIDDQGRVVIPSDICKAAHIERGDSVEFLQPRSDSAVIILRKYDSADDVSVMLTYALDALKESSNSSNHHPEFKQLLSMIEGTLEYSKNYDSIRHSCSV